MSIKKLFLSIFSISIFLLIGLAVLIFKLYETQQLLGSSQELRYQSYLAAQELRQSSDDLTKFARTYVVTGDSKYETMYGDILAIRNGDKPRPERYEHIYWDFVASTNEKPRPDGQPVALKQRMKDLGFTEAEFAKLAEAENNSNALVKTETIAMNAVKGLFDDGKGNFTNKGTPDLELARKL
jgi:methyl-accepting chemotaxis protein